MPEFEKLGQDYLADVLGQPWAEVAAALNKLEMDPKRVDDLTLPLRARVWKTHLETHRRAAEWWARNRPGVVVDPGTTRSLDGTTTRCILRGACGQSCYCARTMWTRGRVPDFQVVDEPLVEAVTESEAWKRQAAISYVNEDAVRAEMAKGPVRITLAPEVAAQLERPASAARLRYLRARADAEWREVLLADGVPEELIGKAGTVVDQQTGFPVLQAEAYEQGLPPLVYEHVVGPVHPYFHHPEGDVEYWAAVRAASDPKTFRQEREGVWRDARDPEPDR